MNGFDQNTDTPKMRATLKEALTTEASGPKVIVASSECMLNRQRRERPLVDKAIKGGERVAKPKFGVDEDVCTGDHACMRLSGCPSLSVKTLDDPLRDDPVAHIDQSCVGCGNCGEVADAAVLCPSFYRTDTIYNASRWDRFIDRARRRAIGLLQRRRETRRLTFADA
jgi:indolepyruvate ferredoxin oxidoreductase alpha subunit